MYRRLERFDVFLSINVKTKSVKRGETRRRECNYERINRLYDISPNEAIENGVAATQSYDISTSIDAIENDEATTQSNKIPTNYAIRKDGNMVNCNHC